MKAFLKSLDYKIERNRLIKRVIKEVYNYFYF